MVAWIISGLPASGKGTQCKKVASAFGWEHLDTGENLRREMQQKTPLGQEAMNYISKGKLVPDFLIEKLLSQMLDRHKGAAGFVFDGFPRTVGQARILDHFTSRYGFSLKGMICLDISEEEIIRRISIRAAQAGRSDDQDPQVIHKRIQAQRKQLDELREFYLSRQQFYTIDGGQPIMEIHSEIIALVTPS